MSDYTFWEKVDIMNMNDSSWQPTTSFGWLVKQPVNYASTSYNSRTRGTSVDRGYSAGNPGGSVLDGFVAMSMWFVDHIWPLRALANAGMWLADSSRIWKLNGPVAGVGACFFMGMAAGPEAEWSWLSVLAADIAGAHSSLLILGIGAVAGWFTLPAFGGLLVITVAFIGMAIEVALICGVLYIAWLFLR